MALDISECGSVAEYQRRMSTDPNTGDYIYINKFNHSLVFSDNGTKSLMSEPVIQEDNIAWYVDLGSSETDPTERLGTSSKPFASMNELLVFLPKHTNGHKISLYVKAASLDQAVSFVGFENLEIHGWQSNSSTNIPVFSFTDCNNIKVFSTDTDTVASVIDCKIGSITNSKVEIAGGTTNTGIINVAGPISNSVIKSDADVIINTEAPLEGATYFDIKNHSFVAFGNVDTDSIKTIRVDSSEVVITSLVGANVSASNNANVRISTMYTAKASNKETSVVADNLSNIAVNAYTKDASEDTDERDCVVIAASNGSRISVMSASQQKVPVKSVTAQTGSYITVATLTGYISSDTTVNPALISRMASTIMYFSDNIDEDHEITPSETKDTMGQINVATSTVDLSGYVRYNAASNS